MTTLARLIAFLLSLAVVACSVLPWVGTANAWDLTLRSLVSPGRSTGSSILTSIGFGLAVSATVVLLGSLLNSRALIILGGLITVALPSIWILSNAVARSTGIPMSQIQIGAYGSVVMGFVVLVLAAVATDNRLPTVR